MLISNVQTCLSDKIRPLPKKVTKKLFLICNVHFFINFLLGHFVTKVSLHFCHQHKILLFYTQHNQIQGTDFYLPKCYFFATKTKKKIEVSIKTMPFPKKPLYLLTIQNCTKHKNFQSFCQNRLIPRSVESRVEGRG